MMGSRKSGRRSNVLYSVWRNSDDRLMILDGTAEACADILGIHVNTFYWLVSMTRDAGHGIYTIRKIDRRTAEKEATG